MRFGIVEFDRDYHVVSGFEEKQFPNREAAMTYCRTESWTGYYYFLDPRYPEEGYPVE